MALEITIGPPLLTINWGHTVAASEPDGQIFPETDKGLYFFDTRLISAYSLFTNDVRFDLLNAASVFYYASRTFLINAAFETEDGPVPARTIGLVLSRMLEDGLHEDCDLTNYGPRRVKFNFEIMIRSDFADLFDVKAGHLVRRGRVTTDWDAAAGTLKAAYTNQDFHRAIVTRICNNDGPCGFANGRLSFAIELEPGQSWHACLRHDLVDGERIYRAPADCFAHAGTERLGGPLQRWQDTVLKIQTSNEDVYQLFRQSIEDMASLRLPVEGTDHLRFVPAAGVPWFVALFGRDSLIAAMQTVLVYPDFARGALEVLGELQADTVDHYRDAEPGKILHELRHGELARLKRVPHTPYYGTADATMLYLITLHIVWRCSGDRALLDQHLPAAERCLEWIDRYGDRDGDGFQEYETRSPVGYENQGWKDAGDAVMNPDGSPVRGPKATCELQGYVYDAWIRMADIYDVLGRQADAQAPAPQGGRPRATLRRRLMGRGQRLLCLLPRWRQGQGAHRRVEPGASAAERDRPARQGRTRRAAADAARHMWSGWGIRTLSSDHPAYNPYSYQNGSVWPHDNSMIAMGFKRYGFHAEAARIARDVSEAASFFMLHQLPELYAGIERDGSNFPVQYTGANVPQAWAAGSVFLLLQAILGFQPDAANGILYLDPWLPPWLPDLTLTDLRIGPETFDIHFEGAGADTRVEVRKGDAGNVRQRPITEGYRLLAGEG